MRIAYHSFHGRYSDNPRAIFERLAGRADLDQVWLADPAHLGGFPAGVETVDYRSRRARDVLEAADLVVANTHTEVPWRKPDRTTYLQTWHGTPLKRIHRDVLFAPDGVHERLDRDIARWDLLLSPNPVSTGRFRRAFGYPGPVLETGYPRNDLLLSPRAGAVRRSVRRRLGAAGRTAVLYAPTWRDDEYVAGGEIAMALDVAALRRTLGDDVVVLHRAHNLVTARRARHLPGVVDVSEHPDIRELLLAADVLVTDYSSTMVDFALTGKPIVLFAYDLDRFRDRTRGFYVDLIAQAPGPVVRTSEEVAEALADLPALRRAHALGHARFRQTYGCLEDGRATDRVLVHLGLVAGPDLPDPDLPDPGPALDEVLVS